MKKLVTSSVGASLLLLTVLLFSSMNTSWEQVIAADGVIVSSMIESTQKDGVEVQHLVLKIENNTQSVVEVSWYLKTWYNGVCRSCNLDQPNEYNKAIKLAPGQVVSGSGANALQELRIFHSFPGKPGVAPLDNFELSDFSVQSH